MKCYILITFHFSIIEIAAGSIVDCLVGFTNTGKNDFVVEALDASLRYPQDYSYFIQNVSLSLMFSIFFVGIMQQIVVN